MAIQVTHRHMSGGTTLEHIESVAWTRTDNGSTGTNTRSEMVTWVDQGGYAFVQGPSSQARVTTVHPSDRPAYIKTEPNHTGTDNLLSLPTF